MKTAIRIFGLFLVTSILFSICQNRRNPPLTQPSGGFQSAGIALQLVRTVVDVSTLIGPVDDPRRLEFRSALRRDFFFIIPGYTVSVILLSLIYSAFASLGIMLVQRRNRAIWVGAVYLIGAIMGLAGLVDPRAFEFGAVPIAVATLISGVWLVTSPESFLIMPSKIKRLT